MNLLKIGERLRFDPLMFQRLEESFHDRIVVTTSRSTHGARDADGGLFVQYEGIVDGQVV